MERTANENLNLVEAKNFQKTFIDKVSVLEQEIMFATRC